MGNGTDQNCRTNRRHRGDCAWRVFTAFSRDHPEENFPSLTKQHAYRLLMLISVLVWSVALAGIGAWVWTESLGSGNNASTINQKINGGTGVVHTGEGNVSIERPGNP